uniref:Uncharacterized protein n=1 Tax=Micrurus carvalhoi TaxID=3147026 RepID=A0A2H6NAI6_9SAUR
MDFGQRLLSGPEIYLPLQKVSSAETIGILLVGEKTFKVSYSQYLDIFHKLCPYLYTAYSRHQVLHILFQSSAITRNTSCVQKWERSSKLYVVLGLMQLYYMDKRE